MSNIQVCDSIIYQKTKLSKVTTILMKQINDIRLNTLVIPIATTQLDASTIPIHRLQHGHSSMVLLIQALNDFFATKKLVNVFQLQALGLREEQEDERNPEGVQHSENDVCSPANVVD